MLLSHAVTSAVAPIWSGPPVCPEYFGFETTKPGNSIVVGHTQTTLLTSVSPLIFLVFGQSNAVSICADTSFVPSVGTENFNFYDGKNYIAKDPLLGAERAGGNVTLTDGSSWATRLASKFVDFGGYPRVIMVNCAIGGTGIEQWQSGGGGVVAERLRWVITALRQAGLRPHAVLQMLGESNAVAGHSAAAYAATNRAVIADIRRFGCTAPVFVSQTSMIAGATTPNKDAIRQGQQDTWSDSLGIFQGPDTDTIGGRSDGTHLLTSAQIAACSDLWFNSIISWQTIHGSLLNWGL